MDDGLPVYLTELDGEIVMITEYMDEPKNSTRNLARRSKTDQVPPKL
jgi:hypothetical protein